MFQQGAKVLIKTLSTMVEAVQGIVLAQDGCWYEVRTKYGSKFFLCNELVEV